MIVAALDSGWLPVLVAVIGGSGVTGMVVAVIRLRPEKDQMTIKLSESAVLVQTGVIESLQQENVRLQSRITDLEATMRSFSEMRTRISALETENRYLTEENKGLRERLQLLETDIADLRGPVRDAHGNLVERREDGPTEP